MSLLHTCRVAVLALAAAASLVLAPSAYAIDTGFQYELNPQHIFGKCLDVEGASNANFTQVIQFDCHRLDHQRFRFNRIVGNIYEIRAVHSDKCLDVEGASNANFTRVIQFECRRGQANQQFRLLNDTNTAGFSSSRIVAVHSDKCLDVEGASNANFTRVIQFECHGLANQQFDGIALAP